MKTIYETGGANPYKQAKSKGLIALKQRESGRRLFDVVYGSQVKTNLTYSEAATEFGLCLLHHLCCEGLASNEGAI